MNPDSEVGSPRCKLLILAEKGRFEAAIYESGLKRGERMRDYTGGTE